MSDNIFKTKSILELAIVVKELLELNDNQIVIGRENIKEDEFDDNLIVIDLISSVNVEGQGSKFCAEKEKKRLTELKSALVAINVFGEKAMVMAEKLSILLKTDKSIELQKKLGIRIYDVIGITDLKFMTGNVYNERVEISLNFSYFSELEINLLRVDEVDIVGLITD